MSTATFAWFSMNTQVTATGMQVEAQSNNTYLLISNTNSTASAIQAENEGKGLVTVALTVADEDAKVYPSSPILPAYVSETAETSAANHKYFASGTTVVSNATTAAAAANWFTAQNGNPTNANDSVKNVNALNTTPSDTYEFSKYVIKKTVYLTVAAGSDGAHNLTVTPTIAAKAGTPTDITGVRVLVVTSNNMQILNSTTSGAQSLYGSTDQAITSSSVVTVDIYIYYDGEASAVYTNNIANLAGATISLAFDVAVGTPTPVEP